MEEPLFFLAMAALGCGRAKQNGQPVDATNVDPLRPDFSAGWNSRDSAAIMNKFSDDAFVYIDSEVYLRRATIGRQWVSGSLKVVHNTQVHSVASGVEGPLAHDAGANRYGLNLPGGPCRKRKATTVWFGEKNRAENGKWCCSMWAVFAQRSPNPFKQTSGIMKHNFGRHVLTSLCLAWLSFAAAAQTEARIKIGGIATRQTVQCNGEEVVVSGERHHLVLKGSCFSLTVFANRCTIEMDSARLIFLHGDKNRIYFKKALSYTTKVRRFGSGNNVAAVE